MPTRLESAIAARFGVLPNFFRLTTNDPKTTVAGGDSNPACTVDGPPGTCGTVYKIRDNVGNLYGTTFSGGDTTDPACSATGGCGVIFRLDSRGPYTVLHTFKGPDGANPQASLYMNRDGDLYGTTSARGDPTCNCGVAFKISHERSWDEY